MPTWDGRIAPSHLEVNFPAVQIHVNLDKGHIHI